MVHRAKVIKVDSAADLHRLGAKSFRMDDVLREAHDSIAAAKVRAVEIVQEAERKAAALWKLAREGGYKAGFEEGLAKGREAGRAEAFEKSSQQFSEQQNQLIHACKQIITDIDAQRADWLAAGRQDLIDLAMAIAGRVAHQVGQRERDVVSANLEEAVSMAGARTDITIMINPIDAETTRAFAKELTEVKEQCQHVRIVEQSEIAPGGCRVQWGSGAVDATLETQLARIETSLKTQSIDTSKEGSQ
jgi:flagellar assembly protein FliH